MPRRRALLATLAAAGATALAGCAAIDRRGTDPTANDGSDGETSEAPSADGFDAGSLYAAVPAATITSADTDEIVPFARQENATLSETLDWLTPAGRSRMNSQIRVTPNRLDLPPERIDEVLESRPMTVVDGEFTVAEVFDAYDYERGGIERQGTDGDYTLGRSPEAPAGTTDVAAKDGRWIRRRSGVEGALAAERGEAAGLASLDPALPDHLRATSSGALSAHQFYGDPIGAERLAPDEGRFEGAIVQSLDFEIAEETVDLELRYLFADSAAADAAAVDQYVGRSAFDPYDLTPTRDGRVLQLQGTAPTDEFDLLLPDDATPPTPQVNFDFEVDGETLTITHTSGDTVPAGSLTVLVGDQPADSQFEDGDVVAGDSVTIDVSGVESGTTVRIVWKMGDASAVLASFTLP